MKTFLLSFLLFSFLSFSACINKKINDTSNRLVSSKTCDPSPNESSKAIGSQNLFPGCEQNLGLKEKRKCSDEKMFEFIYNKLTYPLEAKEKEIEGTVAVSFTVEKDGCISNIKVVKDIGGGCGEEALRICELMPDWEGGSATRVQYNIPINFEL